MGRGRIAVLLSVLALDLFGHQVSHDIRGDVCQNIAGHPDSGRDRSSELFAILSQDRFVFLFHFDALEARRELGVRESPSASLTSDLVTDDALSLTVRSRIFRLTPLIVALDLGDDFSLGSTISHPILTDSPLHTFNAEVTKFICCVHLHEALVLCDLV